MNYLHALLNNFYGNAGLRLLSLVLLVFPPAQAAAPLQLVTAALPPFSFEEHGLARGIAVDLVKEAFLRLKVPISIVFMPMTRAQTMMSSGSADAVFPLAFKEERLAYISYPHEKLVEDRISFFVRQDSDIRFEGDIGKLGQYTFGVERGAVYGSNFTQALLTGQIRKTDEAATQAQNLAKLVGKRFDIAVGPRLVMQYSAEVSGNGNAVKELKPSVDLGLVAYLGFSRQRDHAALIARYDKVMQDMRKDGTYDRILRTYTRR
ncbi:substrate-binding periplasmic protein [Duganella qianjiadongensis]|uniref:Transporter substrate-binding domain-containing protein n=1 Tax=Duganella qianjiadongensis TaxID=2692176 RepID=A0ABW9VMI4_9BURK|nr:transporter substrate-binding domain-containing protein [Duganella qianjiadongensis]MYM39638.1 transporter substrate-binding domain-containing protein [Duganella qianjiadongensis]